MVNINEIIGNETRRIWQGQPVEDTRVRISTPDARSVLARGIRYFVGENAQWLDEYEKIADWLTDNDGLGLLCSGNCGRGKTVICGKVLPIIFQHWHGLVMNTITANDLNERYDEYRHYKIISIDDVGTESVANKYGEKHSYFTEIVDEAERKQKLLVITTNKTVKELQDDYGVRTIDRLRAITKLIHFTGESLRG